MFQSNTNVGGNAHWPVDRRVEGTDVVEEVAGQQEGVNVRVVFTLKYGGCIIIMRIISIISITVNINTIIVLIIVKRMAIIIHILGVNAWNPSC